MEDSTVTSQKYFCPECGYITADAAGERCPDCGATLKPDTDELPGERDDDEEAGADENEGGFESLESIRDHEADENETDGREYVDSSLESADDGTY